MKKRKKRRYTWYIEPLDPKTNSTIAGGLPDEDALADMRCADGSVRNLWRAPRRYVTRLLAAKPHFDLRFNIFRREGAHGTIMPWKFERTMPHRLAASRAAA